VKQHIEVCSAERGRTPDDGRQDSSRPDGCRALQFFALKHLCERGKTDNLVYEVELSINIFQEDVPHDPEIECC
jgi:hypothetical protein